MSVQAGDRAVLASATSPITKARCCMKIESLSDVPDVVNELVDGLTSTGQPAPMSWIVKSLVDAEHSPEMVRECLYSTLRDRVRSVFQKAKASRDEDQGELFPGYDHLQRRYDIERSGDWVVVPIEDMSADECRTKAEDLRKVSRATAAHADELDRWREAKFGSRVA